MVLRKIWKGIFSSVIRNDRLASLHISQASANSQTFFPNPCMRISTREGPRNLEHFFFFFLLLFLEREREREEVLVADPTDVAPSLSIVRAWSLRRDRVSVLRLANVAFSPSSSSCDHWVKKKNKTGKRKKKKKQTKAIPTLDRNLIQQVVTWSN